MKMQLSTKSALLAFAASAHASFFASDAADTFLFSFGDSYTMMGFNTILGPLPSCSIPSGNPPFPGHTTSGGVNWVGQVLDTAPGCLQAWNYGYGGATVNASFINPMWYGVQSFIDQVDDFSGTVARRPAGSEWTAENSAAAVWFGINDIGISWYYGNYSAEDKVDVSYYFGQLDRLYDAGVRNFVIMTVPPTWRTPYFIEAGIGSQLGVQADAHKWNHLLRASAATWALENADSHVQILNTSSIFNNILNHPKRNGAPNATCYNFDGTSCLWWNDYHPGVVIQKAIGDAVSNLLYGNLTSTMAS